jgi:hypothetical protein
MELNRKTSQPFKRSKKTILLLSFSFLDRDPRVQRQISFLKKEYHVIAAGFTDPAIEDTDYVFLSTPDRSLVSQALQAIRLKTKQFESYYWSLGYVHSAYKKLAHISCDLILANDLACLPLALRLAKRQEARVFLDAHEYEPLHFDDSWFFNFFFKKFWDYIARIYLPQVDAMTTVGSGIAQKYSKTYNVPCEVITNAPCYHNLTPTPLLSGRIRMIHHGICNPFRKLENMIYLMDLLDDRYTLDFMIVPNDRRYYNRLRRLAEKRPNVRFRDPVPMHNIVTTLHEYDIGLFLLSPKTYNYRMALPNKLFEFIQARLAVLIWPSPEMARVVRQFDCGIVSEHFTRESVSRELNALTAERIKAYKKNSHVAAKHLCAEQNRRLLLGIVQGLTGF